MTFVYDDFKSYTQRLPGVAARYPQMGAAQPVATPSLFFFLIFVKTK
jgi:hypothetical protein